MLVLKIHRLRIPICSLDYVSLIKGLFMKRRELKGPPILSTLVNHVKPNFNLSSLVCFFLFFTKFTNLLFFKQLNWSVCLKICHSYSKPFYFHCAPKIISLGFNMQLIEILNYNWLFVPGKWYRLFILRVKGLVVVLKS